jgi:hypothetical protein
MEMEIEMEADDTIAATALLKDTSPRVRTAIKSSDVVVMCSSLVRNGDKTNQRRRKRRQQISFGTVHVVQFWPQLGDHPFVSSGCPIALGEPILNDGGENSTNQTNYAPYTAVVDMESYEQRRPSHQRRRSHQLRIPPEERRDILLTMGHSPREIARQIRNIHLLRETMRPSTLPQQRQLETYYSALMRSASGTCNYKIQTI